MNRFRPGVFTAVSLILSGCGGGGGDGGLPLQPQAVEQPAPVTLPMAPGGFNCGTLTPMKTSAVDSLPGGIWRGTLVDCDAQTSKAVYALLSEDGRFRILSLDEESSADILRGQLEMDGNTFDGYGRYFYSDGYVCENCFAYTLDLGGRVRDRDHIDGIWSVDWGDRGYFFFDYLAVEHNSPVPLAQLAGAWEILSDDGAAPAVRWLIDTEGRISGEDALGCSYSGQIALANPLYNLYQLEITVSGCSTEWTYTGFAIWSAGPTNDRLYASVDNDEERALRFLFSSATR